MQVRRYLQRLEASNRRRTIVLYLVMIWCRIARFRMWDGRDLGVFPDAVTCICFAWVFGEMSLPKVKYIVFRDAFV